MTAPLASTPGTPATAPAAPASPAPVSFPRPAAADFDAVLTRGAFMPLTQFGVIDATGEIPYGATPAPTGAHGARLEVEHLGYSYVAGQALLEDVSFTVEPGRTVAIVGATASGKSTLTALLARLVDPDRGRILIDGVDLRDLDRGQLAEVEAVVPQTAFLFDDDVRGNVCRGTSSIRQEMPSSSWISRDSR